MANKHFPHDLKQMQSLPLEAKEIMSDQRIGQWFLYWDGNVYVCFSGGKDSTVVAHLCARFCKRYGYRLYLLFVNTGLEYPEIQRFVKEYAEYLRQHFEIEVQLDIVRPEMRFDEVIKEYGYPVIGKKQANTIRLARQNIKQGKYTMRLRTLGILPDEAREMGLELPSEEMLERYEATAKGSMYNIPQYRYLLDAPFKISEQCCDVMKKAPAKRYAKQTGRTPILGTMAHESMIRKAAWLKNGCNAFNAKHPSSQPIAFWTEQDILHYIKKYNVPYCSVYGDIVIKPSDPDVPDNQMDIADYLGEYSEADQLMTTECERTGCIFCMFGCHLEKGENRFQRLKRTHPRQWEYCIKGGDMVNGKWQPSKEGVGCGKVLDYIGVKYE